MAQLRSKGKQRVKIMEEILKKPRTLVEFKAFHA